MRWIFPVFVLVFSHHAHAACRMNGYGLHPEQNDSVTYRGTTDNGRCGHGFTSGEAGEFKALGAVRRPKNGRLVKIGQFSFGYIANPGFKGEDSYVIRLCATNRGRTGCSTVTYEITVQ